MPLYEYRCPACRAVFELLRPLSDASNGATCPSGHKNATRVVSLVAARAWDGASMSQPALGGGCACGGGSCGCGAH